MIWTAASPAPRATSPAPRVRYGGNSLRPLRRQDHRHADCAADSQRDQRSKDYGNIADTFRPAHADYTYTQKYGFRDPRGGGRSSQRLTAPVVGAGAIAKSG